MMCGMVLGAALAFLAQEPGNVSYDALLNGLIDLRWMCEAPRPGEGADALDQQAQSGEIELRHAQGPGVVGRLWCSRADGTLLIFADDAAEPVRWNLAEFDGRDELSPLPPEPLAGTLGSGWYSMVPLPFQRQIRIVWQPPAAGGAARLQADVRRLGQGAEVPSLTAALLQGARGAMLRVARTIADDTPPATPTKPNLTVARCYHKMKTDPATPYYDGTFYFPIKGDGIIRWFEITFPDVKDPAQVERELRLMQLRIEAGTAVNADRGEVLFELPMGELLGSGIGYNPYDHYLMGLREDGRFISRLPIPFSGDMKLVFTHPTKEGVNFRMRIAAEAMPPESVPPLRLRGGWQLGDATQAAEMLRIFNQDAPVAPAGEQLVFPPAARFTGREQEAVVSARALWYGPAKGASTFGGSYAMEQRLPTPAPAPASFHVDGAVEGESARVLGMSAGATLSVEDWSATVPGVSRRELLLLRPRAAEDQAVLALSAVTGGEYELVARFGIGPGLGRAQLFVDGRKAGEPADTAAKQAGLSEEIVLQRGVFLPREYQISLRSLDGKPLALDYLRLRPVR